MTTITIVKNKAGEITEFTAEGHTNYGVEGEDIVCAAASAIVQTAALGIFAVANVNAEMKRDDKKALFALKLPSAPTSLQRRDCSMILDTMVVGLSDLQQNYSDFIEIIIN